MPMFKRPDAEINYEVHGSESIRRVADFLTRHAR